ncbi:MAG: hypothetical protein Q8P73_03270 [bacterium]|nr:hypothetical protein [bacterium]
MKRTQVYLLPKTHKRLTRLAKVRKTAMAQVLREILEKELPKYEAQIEGGASVLRDVAGLEMDLPADVAGRHDKYLYDKER